MEKIKASIQKSYASKGEILIKQNFCAVDHALAALHEIPVREKVTSEIEIDAPLKLNKEDAFLENVTSKLVAREGDNIPVSAVPADGTWPTATTQYEKRSISLEAPFWDPSLCIQCNKCVEVCPHAVIRSKVFDETAANNAPESFHFLKAKGKNFADDEHFTIKVSVEDCTGCTLCVEECPATSKEDPSRKAINMEEIEPQQEVAVKNWDYFMQIPDYDRTKIDRKKVKEAQFLRPLFEFSGACPGCGETPYLKLLTQLFGDRLLIANATGCSSIYGGNLPTTPWSVDEHGRGPAWANSLFEDNAEFGLGFRTTADQQKKFAMELLTKLKDELGETLVEETVLATQKIRRGDHTAKRACRADTYKTFKDKR
jgi:pyruvate-ferredoxin/flavodoxin oxidoreductase